MQLCQKTNVKWTPLLLGKIENQFKEIRREVQAKGVDSEEQNITKKNHLSSRVITIITGKSIQSGPLRNWIAMQLKHRNEAKMLINARRIQVNSQQGLYYSLPQHNVVE